MNSELTKFIEFARQEKTKVDSILECMGDGLTIQDKDFRIVYQNEAIIELMGEHLGEHCYEAYERSDSICANCQVIEVYRDGGTHRIERPVPTLKGSAHLAITAAPLKDASGRVIGAIEVVRDVTEKRKLELEREQLVDKLQQALEEIHTLRGILPICSFCKNIRNDEGYYERLEAYLLKHSGVQFSHTVCPSCMAKHYPDYTEE